MELAAAADEGVEEASCRAVGEDALVEAVHEVGEDLIEIGLRGLTDGAVEAAPEGGVPGAGERGLRIGLGLGGAEGALFQSLGGVVAAEGAVAAGGAAAGASVRKNVGAAKHRNLLKAGHRARGTGHGLKVAGGGLRHLPPTVPTLGSKGKGRQGGLFFFFYPISSEYQVWSSFLPNWAVRKLC
jgi:hypothetical protein